MVHDTQPCASSRPASAVVNTPCCSITIVRRTTCPSKRCSTTNVPGVRSNAPTTGSVSVWPATRMTGVRISPLVGNHFH